MSAPLQEPVAVSTKDGRSWLLYAFDRSGHGLYALAGSTEAHPVLRSVRDLHEEFGPRGMAYTLPVPGPALSEVEQLRARIAELEAARHVKNKALADAAEEVRAGRERFETLRALCDAADGVGIVSGGWFTVEAVRRAAAGESLPKPGGVTRRVAPVESLRCEDEFHLHHDYRKGRDLPEMGGAL